MSKKGGGDVTVGFRYFLGLHMAICHGPIDKLREVIVGDATVWPLAVNSPTLDTTDAQAIGRAAAPYANPSGRASGAAPLPEGATAPVPTVGPVGLATTPLTSSGTIYINAPEVFGGDKKEGGVQGFVDVMFGEATQGANAYLQNILGAAMPAFRGVLSIVAKQVYVASLNPYLKPWSIYATRIYTDYKGDTQWYAEKAGIRTPNTDASTTETIDGYFFVAAGTACAVGPGTFTSDFQGNVMEVGFAAVAVGNAARHAADPSATLYYMTRAYWTPAVDGTGEHIIAMGNSNNNAYEEDIGISSIHVTRVCPTGYATSTAPDTVNDVICTYTIPSVTDHTETVFGTFQLAVMTADNAVVPEGALAPMTGTIADIGRAAVAARNVADGPGGSYGSGIVSTFVDAYLDDGTGGVFPPGPFGVDLARVQAMGTAVVDPPYNPVHHDYAYGGIAAVFVKPLCPAGYTASWDGTNVVCSIHVSAHDISVVTVEGTPLCPPVSGYPDGVAANADTDKVICTREVAADVLDMNPAHMIRECLIVPTWGKGYAPELLDDISFVACADTLYAEGLGMSLEWVDTGDVDALIDVILQHIDGALYSDRATGLWTLSLVRGDYDVETIPSFTPENIQNLQDFQRPATSELINQVILTYWNRQTRKDTPLTIDNQPLQNANGGIVSSRAVDRTGFSDATVASRIAQRELRSVSTPLASGTLLVNRAGLALHIGSPFKLTWPELGLADLVMRVAAIDYGTLTEGGIRVTAIEDVFATPTTQLIVTPMTSWVDGRQAPQAPSYRYVGETPYWTIIKQITGESTTYSQLDPTSGLLAVSGVRASADTTEANVWTRQGTAGYTKAGPGLMCATVVIAAAANRTDSMFAFSAAVDSDRIRSGSYAAWDDEFVLVYDFNAETGVITLARGVLDTIPGAHGVNSRLLFIEGFQYLGVDEYADTEVVDVKILPKTGSGELDLAAGVEDVYTFAHRHIRPYPPGNVKLQNARWPALINGVATLTYAHRNRLTQTAYLVGFFEGSVATEAGVTYCVDIHGDGGTLKRSVTGLTAASYSYAEADELADNGGQPNSTLTFDVWSVRGTYASWQRYTNISLRYDYGTGYGNYYGGALS
jgi:hypothetical protein